MLSNFGAWLVGILTKDALSWLASFVTGLITSLLAKLKTEKKIDDDVKQAEDGNLFDRLDGGKKLEDDVNGNV